MKNKRWKEFEKWTEKCFLIITGLEKDRQCWDKAFSILKEIVSAERSAQPERIVDPFHLDEDTDYEYDVQGWMEDYLDDLDMHEEYDKLLDVCEELLEMFRWEEGAASDVKFMKASALKSLERNEDAVKFCRQWLSEEADNIYAVAANIYADIAVHDSKEAEELIRQNIPEGTQCTDENDILFTAASAFYKETGNKKEKKRIDQEIAAYEKRLKEYFMGGGDEEDDEFSWDDELPFF